MHVVWHSYLLQSKFSPITVTTPPPPFSPTVNVVLPTFSERLWYISLEERCCNLELWEFLDQDILFSISPIPIGIKASWQGCNQKAENDFQKTRLVWPAHEKWGNIDVLIKERTDICGLLPLITTVRVSEDCVIVQSVYAGLFKIISNRTLLS